jgi:T4 RnlA family RNA ligase
MEYTSPTNRIVIHYPQSELTVLSIRSHLTGETLFARRLQIFLIENNFQSILEHLVPFKSISTHISHQELCQNISSEIQGEGYVVEIIHQNQSSYLVKIKNHKYFQLHHCKDIINSPKHLFQSIINEQSDDFRSLFQNDSEALERINQMEEQVRPLFNQLNNFMKKINLFREKIMLF